MIVSSSGHIGRVFVLRLEDGDKLPDSIEAFARENNVTAAVTTLIGGAGPGKLVAGPINGQAQAIQPIIQAITDIHEIAAVGTIFPDAEGHPKLHMHGALGRGDTTLAGCVRQGVNIWKLAEVVVLELLDTNMTRQVDPAFGFEVLTGGKTFL